MRAMGGEMTEIEIDGALIERYVRVRATRQTR